MAAEFALAVPILSALIFGIIQFGIVFIAKAGLMHGVGEAARFASLWPRRTNAQIIAELQAKSFGIDPARLSDPVITHGISQGNDFTEISVSYTVPMTLLVVDLPTVKLNESRRVYVP